jgi:hypothetical protein
LRLLLTDFGAFFLSTFAETTIERLVRELTIGTTTVTLEMKETTPTRTQQSSLAGFGHFCPKLLFPLG